MDCLRLREEFFLRDGREYFTFLPRAHEQFSAYLERLSRAECGESLVPGQVPQSVYWLVYDNEIIVGQSAIRHTLTPSLRIEGGHIGYAIRPSERRQGYGTHILALTLIEARRRGLARVLVTCDTDNIASSRIIQNNNGIFEGEATSPYSGKSVSRYWIDLPD